ncbi:MAG: lamin tail domain-containing protein [Kofleriaceae bacterium]|nr:lamin tail domain-containing protein [Kofleriaceae bacterium]
MSTRSPVLIGLLGSLALAACGPDATNNRPDAPVFGGRCGNMVVEQMEQCDDGNTTPGDGCTADCKVEQIPPVVCGDGMVAQSEGCDDGDTDGGDGCSSTCSVETGFTCAGAPSVCTEQPQNAMGTCANPFEITLAADANGNLTGSGTGDTSTGSSQVAAAPCDGGDPEPGAGNDHVWKFTLPDTRDVLILMPSTVTFDAILRLQTAPCDVGTEIPEFTGVDGCSDQSFEMDTEALGYVKLPAGSYYVIVDGLDAAAKGTYELQIVATTTTCGDGNFLSDILEFCDDGDGDSGDGCSSKCEIEDGWTCDNSEPSVCTMGGGGSAVPPAAGDLVINEVMLADGGETNNGVDTNCDGSLKNNADEFIELVNKSSKTLDLTGVTIDDSASLSGTQGPRHTFAAAASGSLTLAPGKAVVVWGGGSPACAGVTNWFVASSSGGLGLNDDGDTITVRTAGASPVTITEAVLPGSSVVGTDRFSKTLSPDVTGTSYGNHPAIGPRHWSPGRKIDDSPF